jgi:hypothetical protein
MSPDTREKAALPMISDNVGPVAFPVTSLPLIEMAFVSRSRDRKVIMPRASAATTTAFGHDLKRTLIDRLAQETTVTPAACPKTN